MRTLAITAAVATLLVAVGASELSAHQTGGMMMPQVQPDVGETMPYPGWTAPGFMMGPGMMMGGGTMGHGMTHMMTIMMDTDGDGALSSEEFEAVHARMFNAMDINKDGKLVPEEMDDFMRNGSAAPDRPE